MRYSERENFPEALKDLQQAHWAARMFLQSAADNATEDAANDLPLKYLPEELESITKKLKESERWLNDGVERQKQIKRCGDGEPVILVAEMKARGTALQRDTLKLLKRKIRKVKSATSTAATSSSTAEGTNAGASESTSSTTSTSATESSKETHTRDEL